MAAAESRAGANISALPTELLLHIFRKLDGATFVRARTVCQRWRDVADLLDRDEQLWRRFTLRDFDRELFRDTLRCRPTISWRDVYRSLHLWPRFVKSNDKRTLLMECWYSKQPLQPCSDKIAVLTEYSIHFFSPDYVFLHNIAGHYFTYSENEHVEALLDGGHTLHAFPRGSSEPALVLRDIWSVCVFGECVVVSDDYGVSCYKNNEIAFSLQGNFEGELNCDEQYVYLRTAYSSHFKINIKGEVSDICPPFSCSEFAGLLATYHRSSMCDFLEYSYRQNLDFVKNFDFDMEDWSTLGRRGRYMMSATVYNDLLFVGTYQHDVYIVKFEGFQVVKKLSIRGKPFKWGIESITVTETASAVKIRAHTLDDISVFILDK